MTPHLALEDETAGLDLALLPPALRRVVFPQNLGFHLRGRGLANTACQAVSARILSAMTLTAYWSQWAGSQR